MPCEECNRLINRYNAAVAAYREATGGTSGLHGWDLRFRAANERAEKARELYERCRAALRDHEQHHKDLT
jgi:hypothetical protein